MSTGANSVGLATIPRSSALNSRIIHNVDIIIRGDSGFAIPELYKLCETRELITDDPFKSQPALATD